MHIFLLISLYFNLPRRFACSDRSTECFFAGRNWKGPKWTMRIRVERIYDISVWPENFRVSWKLGYRFGREKGVGFVARKSAKGEGRKTESPRGPNLHPAKQRRTTLFDWLPTGLLSTLATEKQAHAKMHSRISFLSFVSPFLLYVSSSLSFPFVLSIDLAISPCPPSFFFYFISHASLASSLLLFLRGPVVFFFRFSFDPGFLLALLEVVPGKRFAIRRPYQKPLRVLRTFPSASRIGFTPRKSRGEGCNLCNTSDRRPSTVYTSTDEISSLDRWTGRFLICARNFLTYFPVFSKLRSLINLVSM